MPGIFAFGFVTGKNCTSFPSPLRADFLALPDEYRRCVSASRISARRAIVSHGLGSHKFKGDLSVKRTWLLLCLFAVGAAVSADATTIVYDNAGPGSWNTGSPYINSGSSVADSFTLNSAATIDGISFGNWLTPGDTLESVSWQFTTASNGGTILGSGTATSFSNVNEGDPFGYVANDSTFGIPSLSLNANTTYNPGWVYGE